MWLTIEGSVLNSLISVASASCLSILSQYNHIVGISTHGDQYNILRDSVKWIEKKKKCFNVTFYSGGDYFPQMCLLIKKSDWSDWNGSWLPIGYLSYQLKWLWNGLQNKNQYLSMSAKWRQRPKWNVNTEQRDEIGLAVQSWLWVRVELMAW